MPTLISLKTNQTGAGTLSQTFSGPIRKRVEIWVYSKEKQLLCARRTFANKLAPGRWQTYISTDVPESSSYMEAGLNLLGSLLKIQSIPGTLTELHLRLNESADEYTRVYALAVGEPKNGEPLLPHPTKEFSEFRWLSLYEIELKIKNRELSHPMDYRVVEFLKNP